MAKDGTNRGGKRTGAGRKRKPLAEKIQEGKKATALSFPNVDPYDNPEIDKIKNFLSTEQVSGAGELYGKEVFEQMVDWLRLHNAAHLVNPQLLEQYSMAMARWIQAENKISDHGFLGQHPTTRAIISNPYVSIAQAYLKQANLLYQQIFSIVAANSTEPVTGNPQDAMMEKLLTHRPEDLDSGQ